MNTEHFRGKKVTILGFARSGKAAAQLLADAGAKVRVSESQSQARTKEDPAPLIARGVEFEFGGHQGEGILRSDLIVISPGVPSDLPVLKEARQAGIRVIGEVELASLFTSALFVGVTGSNGKSTTTTLIGEMLKKGTRPAIVAGNIGTPLCQVVQGLSSQYIIVTELSSFQLETIETFRCPISLLLNISPDHLDRYQDLMDYARAKARIFENQREGDFAIVNADDTLSLSLSSKIKASRLLFSRAGPVREGCYAQGGKVFFRRAAEIQEICSVSEIAIRGVHNLENAMAAISAASLLELDPMAIKRALQEFPGLEHRLELVLEKDGIRFVNDSKGTNVGAVLKSLESFTSPVILIAGGRDKDSDFSPLAAMAKGRVKVFVLLGEAKEKMRISLRGSARIVEAEDMGDAVQKASSMAERGDIVLLSPACASFDMFANFEERGRVFRHEVMSLHQGQGVRGSFL